MLSILDEFPKQVQPRLLLVARDGRIIAEEDAPAYDAGQKSGDGPKVPFCMMPRFVVREYGPKVGAIPIAVYLVLTEHADRGGKCWPSYAQIGKMIDLSRRQVIRAIQTLAEHGLVKIEYRRDDDTMRAQSNVYLLPFHCRPSDAQSLGVVTDVHHPSDSGSLPSDTQSPRTIPIEQEPINEKGDTPLPPKRRRDAPDYSSEFEAFWSLYPAGHGAKKKAFEEWQRIRPDAETQAAMVRGLEAWKLSDRWRRGYIKDAERWIKDRWWENAPKVAYVNGKAPPVPTEYADDGGLAAIRAMGQRRGEQA